MLQIGTPLEQFFSLRGINSLVRTVALVCRIRGNGQRISLSELRYLLNGEGGVRHVTLTFTAAVGGYLLLGNSSASPEATSRVNVAEGLSGDWLHEGEFDGAVILIALMVCLNLGMCALRHVNSDTFTWLRQWRSRRSVHSQHDDCAGVAPAEAAPEVPKSDLKDIVIDVETAAPPDKMMLRQYLDAKSMHELTLLAAATCNSDDELKLFVRNNLGRSCVQKAVADSIANGKFELSYLPLKHLQEVALRKLTSEDKDNTFRLIFDSINPHRQLVRWIVEREARNRVWPHRPGHDWIYVGERVVKPRLVQANDMAMAACTTARKCLRQMRATFVDQRHVEVLRPVQEET